VGVGFSEVNRCSYCEDLFLEDVVEEVIVLLVLETQGIHYFYTLTLRIQCLGSETNS